jgi:hypothetical protein
MIEQGSMLIWTLPLLVGSILALAMSLQLTSKFFLAEFAALGTAAILRGIAIVILVLTLYAAFCNSSAIRFFDQLVFSSAACIFLAATIGVPTIFISRRAGITSNLALVLLFTFEVVALSFLWEYSTFPNDVGIERWLRAAPELVVWSVILSAGFCAGAEKFRRN